MRGIFYIHTMSTGTEVTIDMGNIQTLSDEFSPQLGMVTGIPAQPSENAFVMDLGVRREISISFIRSCPSQTVDDLYGDSSKWSNGYWLTNIAKHVVNRWQTATDGVKVSYVQGESGRDNFPNIPKTNCFVKQWSVRYTRGIVQAIVGTATFIVGSTTMQHASMSTVVYMANFSEISANATTNSTNLVKSYESPEGIPVLRYPSNWVTYATEVYGVTPDPDDVWFCTNTYDTLSDALDSGTAYHYNPTATMLEQGFKNTISFFGLYSLTLYARYSR